MDVKADSNFQFSVDSIHYTATGEICISLTSEVFSPDTRHPYFAGLGWRAGGGKAPRGLPPTDKVTTLHPQHFIEYLMSQGLKTGTVRPRFRKLACALHDACRTGGKGKTGFMYSVGND